MDDRGGLVWKSFMTNYPGLTDDSVPETSHSYFCFRCLEKRKCVFPYWMQCVGSVSWGHKCECSDALHAQMSLRVLILGNDSFNLKICFMNKAVMITICMCGWGMLGQTGKQGDVFDLEWDMSAATYPPRPVVTGFLPGFALVLSLQFHPIPHRPVVSSLQLQDFSEVK